MENTQQALDLIASSHEAALATLEDGKPFTSAVSYLHLPYQDNTGTEKFGRLAVLLSSMARHTKNLMKNPDVSLLVLEKGDDYLYERKRVSVQGQAAPAAQEKAPAYREEYLKLFPQSKILFSLPDFQFYEVKISSLYFIGGFGKIENLS